MGYSTLLRLTILVTQLPFAISDTAAGFPILLIPGAGGSRLMAKWDKPKKSSPTQCERKQSSWYQLWPTPQVALPFAVDCWVDNIKLTYNETDGSTFNTAGVDTDFPGFGQTDKLEYLTDVKVSTTKYMKDLVAEAKKWGYKPGVNIRGAPYDFRKSPHEQSLYFENLKELIENMYDNNGAKPIVMLAHSLGGLYTQYFLQQQTRTWKKKYIRALVSLGTPYIGALTAIEGNTQGYNLNQVILPAAKLRTVQRTWLSMTAMLPDEKFWPSTPYITTPDRNYTVKDYPEFFKDIDYTKGLQMLEKMRGKLKPDVAPSVEVHCLVGSGIDTPITFAYKKSDKFPEGKTKVIYTPGDGTVPLLSQNFCTTWAKSQKEKFEYREFPNVNHFQLVSNADVLSYIKSVVTDQPIISSALSFSLPN